MARRTAVAVLATAALASAAPGASAATPRELEVRCTTAGTSVLAPRVAEVRMGGAWFHVINRTKRRMAVVVEAGAERAPSGSRDILPEVEGWMRFALPPGRWRVACIDPANPRQDPPSDVGYRRRLVPVRLVDNHGWYRSEALACEEQTSSIADFASGTAGRRNVSDLPPIVRRQVDYARPTDIVGDAGYAVVPDWRRTYRLLRGNDVIGLVAFEDYGQGWLLNTTTTCSDAPA
jgi:hypothetical protein